MKALELMKKFPSVEERATAYATSIKRDLYQQVIEPVIRKKERLEDEIADLKNFSLNTNLNQGVAAVTKEECLKRFKEIIQKEYELELTKKELEIKQKSFDFYFEEPKTA